NDGLNARIEIDSLGTALKPEHRSEPLVKVDSSQHIRHNRSKFRHKCTLCNHPRIDHPLARHLLDVSPTRPTMRAHGHRRKPHPVARSAALQKKFSFLETVPEKFGI